MHSPGRSMNASAFSSRIRSMPSASGTRTSPPPPTTTCASCSRGLHSRPPARRVNDQGASTMSMAILPELSDELVIEVVRKSAHPLRGLARDYDPLLELCGNARFVLIGEASHGTH